MAKRQPTFRRESCKFNRETAGVEEAIRNKKATSGRLSMLLCGHHKELKELKQRRTDLHNTEMRRIQGF